MSIDRGPEVTVGTIGENTRLATADTFKTRYRLIVRQRQYDVCVIPLGEPMVAYDLSMIDNQSGQEVMTQSGKGCIGTVSNKFIEALKKPG
jgi:hypothetical protein